MISQTFLEECQNPSRWHSSKMLSKTYPSSALLKPLMNTHQLHLDMVLSHTFHTHPIMIFSSMHVSGMIPPTLQPPQREEMCIQLLEHRITPTLMSPTKHCSPKALILLQMISTKYTRPNRVNHHLNHCQVFRRTNKGNLPYLHPRSHLRNMMVLSMSLQKSTNVSAQKQMLPSRNITLRPSTNLPRKEVFMSQI